MDEMTRFKILWQGYLTDTLNASEAEELLTLIRKDKYFQEDHVAGLLAAPSDITIDRKEGDEIFEALLARIHETPAVPGRIHFLHRWKWAAAAIIVIGTAVSIAFFSNRSSRDPEAIVTTNSTAEIAPGKDGAILTLADGSHVSLDSIQNGAIAQQSGVTARVTNGRLVYEGKGNEVEYNTISTPRGRKYRVALPDGTEVWLNAISSIRYPTVFAGQERRVEVTGEAYFEVAKNAKMPFRVIVNKIAEVEVLGTHFNVNAYENEASINTTLLEGSVKVNGTTIKPGQQAQIATEEKSGSSKSVKVINNADIDNVMAWKNGLINFEGATFDAIMRQLERWYDIEVVYENNIIPATRLAGKMTRGVSLDGLLKNLEALGVHYKLDGRKLIILQ